MSGRHAPTYTPDQRAEVIRRFEIGQTQQQISEATKVRKSTVGAWIQAHKMGQREGEAEGDLPNDLQGQVADYVRRLSIETNRSIVHLENAKQPDPDKVEKALKVVVLLDKLAKANGSPPAKDKPESALDRLAGELPEETA